MTDSSPTPESEAALRRIEASPEVKQALFADREFLTENFWSDHPELLDDEQCALLLLDLLLHEPLQEHLARVVFTRDEQGRQLAYPDTCVGTDSHTPMVNGLGVVAWGVGGIEAEAAMLGQPLYQPMPIVVGFRLDALGAIGELEPFDRGRYAGPVGWVDASGDGDWAIALPAVLLVINGLPLMTNGGLSSAYDVENLDQYYTDCVIGGPGAFMIPVNEWSQFPEAIRRKLVLELAGPLSPHWRTETGNGAQIVLAQAAPGMDCLIGEKLWRDRQWMWQDR